MANLTTTSDLALVDLTDLELWADGPPYELFARMRAECPIRWNPSADGVGFWSLTQAELVRQVSEDPQSFSSHRGGIFLRPDALAPLEFARNFPIFKDPPEHDTYRTIVAQAFSPRAMKLLDQEVREVVTHTLDTVLQDGDSGECDLVADVAAPIAVKVIGKLMGSRDEDMDQLQHWTQEIQRGMTYSRDVTPTLQEMAAHFMQLVNNSRTPGVESLTKSIRLAQVDGSSLTDEEIAVYLGMLLYAGNEPTRGAISAGLEVLIQHPEQTELLRQQPSLLKPPRSGGAPAALAEILRWSSPVSYFARTATTDTSVGGQDVKADDRLVMWYPAANRDPDVIADPDEFDVTRDVSSFTHYSFGGGGPHHCQGDFLANKTLCITLQEAIKRLGDMKVVGEVTRVSSTFANSLTSLPISFTPATGARPQVAQPRAGHGQPATTAAPPRATPAPVSAPTAQHAAPEPAPAAPEAAPEEKRPGLFKRLFGRS